MATSRETVYKLLYPRSSRTLPDNPHAAEQIERVRIALDAAYEAGKSDGAVVREMSPKNMVLLLLLETGRQAIPDGAAHVSDGGTLKVYEGEGEDTVTTYAAGFWKLFTYVTSEQYEAMEAMHEKKENT